MRRMPFGAEVTESGVSFRVWAPNAESVRLQIVGEADLRPMQAVAEGFHEIDVDGARPGALYKFALADMIIPDPASRFQPQDVHGPSEVIDPLDFAWRDADWRGRPWEEALLYELHIGAFTEAGTFRSAIEKLGHLVELGVTAIELMPVADFPGRWNWGYDGVLLFAPDSSYGRPEDLKALVDAAHRRELMVILDVVYNHFGPEGNFLPACGPIFTHQHHTPWGAAVNFDAEGSQVVRELIVANALYWIEEFHFDGLRLDAVHALKDDSEKHLLDEIAEAVRRTVRDREVHFILENDENKSSRLARDIKGRPIHYTAQWNDDLHHLLHTAAASELQEFYAEYAGDAEKLGRCLAEGFAFQGEWTTHNPRRRGEPSAFLPPTAFISFLQNHDQIGNRPFGERFVSLVSPKAARAVVALMLLAPQVPLLFMGEEWGSRRPFLFFSDFTGELADAVRRGRREEFSRYPDLEDPQKRDRIPDPIAPETFRAVKLDWSEAEQLENRQWREFYRSLIALRRAEIVPRLKTIPGHAGTYRVLGHQAVEVLWTLGDGSVLQLLANLKSEPLEAQAARQGRQLWLEGGLTDGRLGAWTVIYSVWNAGSRGD